MNKIKKLNWNNLKKEPPICPKCGGTLKAKDPSRYDPMIVCIEQECDYALRKSVLERIIRDMQIRYKKID